MAIENTSGDVLNLVQQYCQHLAADNSGTFSSFTAPKVEDLNRLIDITATEILSWVADAGYDNNIATWDTASKNFFGWYNAIGACYRIEIMHPGMNASLAENTRIDLFKSIYDEFHEKLLAGEILPGLLPQDAGALQATFTARLISSKDADRLNTDAVQPFFSRDKFRHPGTRPTATDTAPVQ